MAQLYPTSSSTLADSRALFSSLIMLENQWGRFRDAQCLGPTSHHLKENCQGRSLGQQDVGSQVTRALWVSYVQVQSEDSVWREDHVALGRFVGKVKLTVKEVEGWRLG